MASTPSPPISAAPSTSGTRRASFPGATCAATSNATTATPSAELRSPNSKTSPSSADSTTTSKPSAATLTVADEVMGVDLTTKPRHRRHIPPQDHHQLPTLLTQSDTESSRD